MPPWSLILLLSGKQAGLTWDMAKIRYRTATSTQHSSFADERVQLLSEKKPIREMQVTKKLEVGGSPAK